MSDNTVRWGILSTAKIGTEKVIPAMQQGELSRITAIASRDADRPGGPADALGIPNSHGSYEDLLADPEIDAIYNPLPNHLHVSLSFPGPGTRESTCCVRSRSG
ncbi:MAG: hypothetical protein Ct9H300mP1_36450 [Planctomycetaceae bacterium]|nr:MAG: hypothetical protein Ct9H300mP1_36450 [Planctomycetaceae bacterium]